MIEWIASLQDHALFGLALTLAAYGAATALWSRFNRSGLLHPVLVATLIVSLVLMGSGLDYQAYFIQARVLNDALALILVLLAVPLYRQFPRIRHAGLPLAIALAVGSLVALATALTLPVLLGASEQLLATLAPKSATAAIAVQVAELLGGVGGLAAVIVISTGIFGAVFGLPILESLGVDDPRAQGFALGVASHAIGTARAFQISDTAGAFAGLGMILNGLLTMALVPLVLTMLRG
ncbi:MAG: LrgB family protein [Pseudomonadota bacterium]